MSELILEMRGITKLFPGVRALDNVNLQVKRGEIHAIVGENGAGKSTLMNVLSGIYPHGTYEGQIIFQGEECHFKEIRQSEHKGIVIIHQELALIPYLSIGENIFLGNERGRKLAINWTDTYARADELLKTVGLEEPSQTLIKDISVGKQQLVEIAKALARNVKLLILDEPTASLNEKDSQNLLNLLLAFKKEGLTSILISHKLNEVSYVADTITILRDGTTIETLDKARDSIDEPRIIRGMVGREIVNRFPKRESVEIGEKTLEISDWTVYHPLFTEYKVVDRVSMHVRRGEVVGISGLMGAGRTELAMSVFGKSYGSRISGTVSVHGKPTALGSVRAAIRNKIAYITEDRKGNGLILTNPVKVNVTLARTDKISRHGVIDRDMEVHVADDFRAKLGTKCTSVEQDVGNLSGGNQQKVLLSKWMFAEPDILILDEPTRGIDVGAKYEIYNIINDLARQGKSVLMISSELSECLGMCDRIYVMNEGRVVGEVSGKEATQESIMTMIVKSSGKGA